MKEVGTHRNIVSMLGYWIQSHPIMLIMEYVPNGDLLQWLRNKRQQVSLLYQLYQHQLFFAHCLKNTCSPFAIGLRTGIIYRTQTQTNKFLISVCFFAIKMSSFSDFCHENDKNGRFQKKHYKVITLTSLLFCAAL